MSFSEVSYILCFLFHVNFFCTFQSQDEIEYSGNLFLSKLVGADLYFAPRVAPYETELKPRMEAIATNIE